MLQCSDCKFCCVKELEIHNEFGSEDIVNVGHCSKLRNNLNEPLRVCRDDFCSFGEFNDSKKETD